MLFYCLWIYCTLFIHVSIDGHFGFYTICLNNAAVTIHAHVFVCTYGFIFFEYIGEFLGHTLYVEHFEEVPDFSQWLHHFTFPPAMYEGSNFSTSFPTLIICFFNFSQPSGRGFDLRF